MRVSVNCNWEGIMIWFALLSCALLDVTNTEHLSRHRRSWIIDSFTLEEGHPGPFPYELGKIKVERAYEITFAIFGEGVDEYPKGILTIDKMSGIISVHKSVDYEDIKSLSLKLLASKADKTLDTKLGIEITILDINDNPPSFQKDLYEVTIKEDVAQGTELLTVLAYDRDEPESPNSTFHYEISSISPKLPDAEFVLGQFGELSFRGCLNYEVGDTYTVLLVVKDHGEVVSLSSTTTALIHVQGGNNHLPVISGQTGPRTVNEGETGFVPLRLHVTDRDPKHTPAWKAKYTMEGDEGGNFKIETDPVTNDGILTVIKPMDFEAVQERELLFSVENEMPHYSCEVEARPASGLWVVDSSGGETGAPGGPNTDSLRVTIQVEDVNDPPMFTTQVREAKLEENADIGTYVETVTALDPDLSHGRDFTYMLGDDPGGWLKVDPHTGVIKTAKRPDRESPHVVNNIYAAVIHAVDSGEPPMTGTATLLIRVFDQNDNVPKLSVNSVVACVSDAPTRTNLTALDPDNEPFGGPFIFELLGEVEGKWSVDPPYGHKVNLVKEPIVHSGIHVVKLKITDQQGASAVNNLTVTVCDCIATPNCIGRRASAATVDSGAMGVLFFALLALLITLMLAFFMTCKAEFSSLKPDLTYEVKLLSSNIEERGTDCKIPNILDIPTPSTDKWELKQETYLHDWCEFMQRTCSFKAVEERFDYQDSWVIGSYNNHDGGIFRKDHNRRSLMSKYQVVSAKSRFMSEAALLELLHQRLAYVQTTEDAWEDYSPQLYADEGEDTDTINELEKINISEAAFDHRQLDNLDPSFKNLASICKPTALGTGNMF